jgi:hypothetical protein
LTRSAKGIRGLLAEVEPNDSIGNRPANLGIMHVPIVTVVLPTPSMPPTAVTNGVQTSLVNDGYDNETLQNPKNALGGVVTLPQHDPAYDTTLSLATSFGSLWPRILAHPNKT